MTGCIGFIGSHLCEALLKRGHQVIGLDNFDPFYDPSKKEAHLRTLLGHVDFQFIEMDLTDPVWFQEDMGWHHVGLVIHLAAKVGVRDSINHSEEYFQTNVFGLQNLIDWMRSAGVSQIIHASSSSVYGKQRFARDSTRETADGSALLGHPVNEDSRLNPLNPYAESKVQAEKLLNSQLDLQAVHLRFFSVYGPRQRPDLLFPKILKHIERGSSLEVYGDGSSSRDYTHVKDVVQAILKTMSKMNKLPPSIALNIGSGQPRVLRDLLDQIQQKSALHSHYTQAKDYEMTHTWADISLARVEIGYEPSETLDDFLDSELNKMSSSQSEI